MVTKSEFAWSSASTRLQMLSSRYLPRHCQQFAPLNLVDLALPLDLEVSDKKIRSSAVSWPAPRPYSLTSFRESLPSSHLTCSLYEVATALSITKFSVTGACGSA